MIRRNMKSVVETKRETNNEVKRRVIEGSRLPRHFPYVLDETFYFIWVPLLTLMTLKASP